MIHFLYAQIEDLEARQKSLLEQKSDAETVLASTAAKVCGVCTYTYMCVWFI